MSAGMGAPNAAVDSSVSETLHERRAARAGGPRAHPGETQQIAWGRNMRMAALTSLAGERGSHACFTKYVGFPPLLCVRYR